MSIKMFGDLLTANEAEQTVDYTLLTYGEEGHTSKGKVSVAPGTLEVPHGTLPVNDDHAPDKAVGYTDVTDDGAKLIARVHYFHTPEGEAAFTAAATKKKPGLSMEVLRPVIAGGKLLAGLLVGAATVARPAFPSSLLLAADYSEEPAEGEASEADAEALDKDLEAAKAAIEAGDTEAAKTALELALKKLAPSEPVEKEEPTVPQKLEAAHTPADPAAALAKLLASHNAAPVPPAGPDTSLAAFTKLARDGARKDGLLLASHLETMTQTDLYDPAAVPAYLGELWVKAPYEEIFAPLVAHEGLTALSYKGFRWVEGSTPLVDDWDPAFTDFDDEDNETPGHAHMNPIPTSRMRLENKEFYAKRLAGGNRFDRAPVLDFPVPGVMESFLSLQTEEIKRKRDARVRKAILDQAKLFPLKEFKGYTARDLENTFRRIIVGAMHVRKYGKPTFALVGNDIYRDMLGTDMLENLALLEKSLGLEGGTMAGFKIAPADIDDTELDGRVLVGVDKSVVLHEPAGAPIRVDAQELAVGAVDKAVFSYYMLRADDRGGIVEVPGE